MALNIHNQLSNWNNRRKIVDMAKTVAKHAKPDENRAPVVIFNASTRLTGFSQNAAFSLLTSWGLRLTGVPVHHIVCQRGMSHCVLGTNREDHYKAPPCKACIKQSNNLYTDADVQGFAFKEDQKLARELSNLDIQALSNFTYGVSSSDFGFDAELPLGSLVLPSIRWALRRHHLSDDEPTRYLLRQYILSAHNIAVEFNRLLRKVKPGSALIFNGIMYPEATARWVALQIGIRVITHEVSFQPYSAFFTDGQATAYPIPIPDDFELSQTQNKRLDDYLEKRFQGKFSMAGIRFWPEMRGLDADFLQKASKFRQIVPVFTNVVYDTSQVHANRVFPHMFAWLDLVAEIIRAYPDTLFVIRAHPDEMRPGTAKQSRETVQDWVYRNRIHELPNTVFIKSEEYISSYELIQRAKFVMVYNSSIGMEAALMGAAVLCGGNARYTQYPMVFFPRLVDEYRQMADDFLARQNIEVPLDFTHNARRFLYYQLYRASLSFADYLGDGHRKGLVELLPFSWQDLLPDGSPTLQILTEKIPQSRGSNDGAASGNDHVTTFLLDEPILEEQEA